MPENHPDVTDEELLALHAAATSWRDKAAIESSLWHRAPKDIRSERRREYLAGLLGEPRAQYECRYRLNTAGDWAGPILAQVDEGKMSLGVAVSRLEDARSVHRFSHVPLAEAAALVLVDYNAAPVMRNGRRARQRPASKITGEMKTSRAPRAYYARIRAEIASYVREQVGADLGAERLAQEFQAEIETMLVAFQQRVQSARSHRREVTAREIERACSVLSLDPPARGTPLSETLALARRQRNRLVRLYHPDKNRAAGGDTKEQYQAVVEAYGVIVAAADAAGSGQANAYERNGT